MSAISSPDDLKELKRADLQKLAKQHGIKANLKNDKLRDALGEVLFSSPETPVPAPSSTKQKTKTLQDVTKTPLRKATPGLKMSSKTPTVFSPMPGSSKLTTKTATPKIIKPATPRMPTPKVHVSTPKTSGKKMKRRTLDKETSAERPAKRVRRNTYDKDEPSPHLVASPSGPVEDKDAGAEELMSVMSGDMTDEQMKQSLLNALDKRVPAKEVKDSDMTKLPRYTGLSAKSQKKPTTPGNKDWDRIHNKHFSKMQSIDEYLAKKKARTDNLSASMKKVKQMRDNMKSKVDRFKSYQTPPSVKKISAQVKKTVEESRPKFASPSARKFVPTVTSLSKANFNFTSKKSTSTPATTRPAASTKPFVPTVTSVSKANFTFTSRKSISKTTTPGTRKSPRLSGAGNENRQSTGLNRTVTLNKSTPFTFKGNTSTLNSSVSNQSMNSTQKNKFDLKASLSKPLTWKPHSGALKPFSMNNTTAFGGTREVQLKEVPVKSKVERRQAQAKERAEKRLNVKLQRRGLQA